MNITHQIVQAAYRKERKPTQAIITIYLSALLLLVALTISSCGIKQDLTPTPQLVFGVSYTLCAGGDCDHYYAISEGKLYPTSGKYHPGPLVIGSGTLSQTKYLMAKTVLDDIPEFLLRQENHNATFGCPNCHDQGEMNFEYLYNGEVVKWHIDNDTTALPAELRTFAYRTLNIINQLK